MAMGRNLCEFAPGAKKLASDARKIPRRPAEIMIGHHNTSRKKHAPEMCRRSVLRGFNFDIAPAASRPYRLHQNFKLRLAAALKSAPSLTAAASCDQHRVRPLVA
jgi:hypothetical protein